MNVNSFTEAHPARLDRHAAPTRSGTSAAGATPDGAPTTAPAMTTEDQPDALSDEFRDWLLTYARMLDIERADDAVQEAFIALISRQRRPPPVVNPRGYLVRVVQRSVSRRRRTPFRLPAGTDHHDDYPDPDLARAIASLPQRQQACLALRFGHDLTIAAIAKHLDLTESTVRSYLARALDRLGRLLEEAP